MKRRLLLGMFLAAASLSAQMTGFSKDDLVKYTRLNPYGRFPDGRPKVPDGLMEKLRKLATSTHIWSTLRGDGFLNQFEGGWQITHPEKRLVGRAFTAQFIPRRPDVEEIIEAEAAKGGLARGTTQRVIDFLQPGDVLVVDVMGRIEDGTFGGDNLSTATYGITGNGFVINGAVRDTVGVYEIDAAIYTRGYHPSGRDAMLVGINVPIHVGKVTVMPGDVVFGDREGVNFIPPHLVEKVVGTAQISLLHDEWTKKKFLTGKYKASEIYSTPKDPALRREYEEWLAERKKELGLE